MRHLIARLRTTFRSDKGFTLVELLVTVTIMGILAAVVTVGVSGISSSSQTKANQALYHGYQSLVDAWLASNPLQDPEKDVPTLNTRFTCTTAATTLGGCAYAPSGPTTEAGANQKWFTADGLGATIRLLSAIPTFDAGAIYIAVDPTSARKDGAVGAPPKTEFNKFFRLGSAKDAVCVVTTTASNNVFACKN